MSQSSSKQRVLKRSRGRLKLKASEIKRRESGVIKFRKLGLFNDEIGEMLNLSTGTVSNLVTKLIAEGKIERQKKGRINYSASWRDVNHERTQKIIEMKKQGLTLEAIGKKLGRLTKERVRQLVNKIQEVHGPEILKPEQGPWTISQAAKKLKIDRHTVRKLCRTNQIPCQKRSEYVNAGYLIDQAGIKALRRHVRTASKAVCVECGKEFRPNLKKTGRKKRTCSVKCEKQRKKSRWIHAPWIKTLAQRLEKHVLPPDENWISIGKASALTALNVMYLWRLSDINILPTKDHSTRMGRSGKPVQLYAVSTLAILREVYFSWKQQQRK